MRFWGKWDAKQEEENRGPGAREQGDEGTEVESGAGASVSSVI
jgi:hypothetical protein